MTFFEEVSNFLFPEKCAICGKKERNIICIKCLDYLEKYENIQMHEKISNNIDLLIYLFKYEKIIRKEILAFKFFDKPKIGKAFAKIIVKNEKVCGKIEFCDIIIPVPMSKIKKAQRGYNQTEILANEISKNFELEYSNNILIKIKNNKRQSSLSKLERLKNVEGVFKIQNEIELKNKKIILIDDIFTTGATLNECAKMLKMAGARQVIALVIAKD